MPVRKAKLTRRPAITTAAEYEAAWKHAKYFDTDLDGKHLTRQQFHEYRFDSEDELRRLWESDKAAFLALPLIVGGRICRAGCRHPLWWQFDSPQPRVENWPEVAQLGDMRLLTADEITALRAEAVAEDDELHARPMHAFLPFRRSVGFWMFCATEQRNPDIFESSQLVKMGALTSAEKEAIAEPARAIGRRRPLIFPARTLFFYIPKDERILLGIDAGHDAATERILRTPPALCGQ
jgi:hypothetical protein